MRLAISSERIWIFTFFDLFPLQRFPTGRMKKQGIRLLKKISEATRALSDSGSGYRFQVNLGIETRDCQGAYLFRQPGGPSCANEYSHLAKNLPLTRSNRVG
jgi:hypothetical protein